MNHHISTLLKGFSNPSDKHRAKPFWSWNSDLEKDKLLKQIHEMKNMGISGALVHSRSGLITDYLGKNWFDLVNAVCREAAENNFTIWIYDEDRWPSGTAGGKVTKDPANRQKRLMLEIFNPTDFEFNEKFLATFKIDKNDREIKSCQRIYSPSEIDATDSNKKIFAFKIIVMPCTDWYNGGAYLDTLDKNSVKQFIKSTHEKYLQECGQYFGNVISTVFTDEPHHESVLAPTIYSVQNNSEENSKTYEIPWTTSLPEFFSEKYGYDILDHLPYIFFDIPATITNLHRHNYHDCITSMFTTFYAGQLNAWAEKNGLIDTGHIFWESPLNKMVSYVGSMMRFMEKIQMPAVDIVSSSAVFTNGRDEYDSIKQCTSIAHQFGKEQVLSELYACCGWEFTPQDMKRIGDWQATLGVNLRCQSCFAYSTINDGKRDFPPSYFHVPWKDIFCDIEDYYARLNAFISIGKPIRNVLVIHPNESLWQNIKADWTQSAEHEKIEKSYNCLLEWLLGAQIDFDYGDEEIMSRHASININNDKILFQIGQAEYKTIIVPDLFNIRNSTLKLLETFSNAGGKVIFCGQIPSYLDGSYSTEAKKLSAKCIAIGLEKDKIIKNLQDTCEIKLSTNTQNSTLDKILCSIREDDKSRYIVLHNTSTDTDINQLSVTVTNSFHEPVVYEANPFNGNYDAKESCSIENKTIFQTDLQPLELKLFIISKNCSGKQTEKIAQEFFNSEDLTKFDISIDSPNICVLDFAEININNKDKFEDYLYNADIKIRQSMGWPRRRFNMLQPWADKEWDSPTSTPVNLKYRFTCEQIPSELYLAMEKPERFSIKLNGNSIPNLSDKYFIDHSIIKIPLNTQLLQTGANTIEMSIDYKKADGLEGVYLLGDFDVEIKSGRPVLLKPTKITHYEDLTQSGKPFYYGTVTYSYNIHVIENEKTVLSLPDWNGACFKVIVNDTDAGYIAYKPYEKDITAYLTKGKNKLSLTLYSTSRNFFGPFHCEKPFRGKGWTDPRDYECPEFNSHNTYETIPFGINKPPVIKHFKTV